MAHPQLTWGEIGSDMATELLKYREAERTNLQCWLGDDPETGSFDEPGMADIIADNLEDNGETTEEILCGVRLPNRTMRVWLTGGRARDVHFEWVEKS